MRNGEPPIKRWFHIFIDFIVGLPINRHLWGKNCIDIMVVVNKLNKMVKCIFIDGITAKDAANVFYIHIWKNLDLFTLIIIDWGRTFANYFLEPIITKIRENNKLIICAFNNQVFLNIEQVFLGAVLKAKRIKAGKYIASERSYFFYSSWLVLYIYLRHRY